MTNNVDDTGSAHRATFNFFFLLSIEPPLRPRTRETKIEGTIEESAIISGKVSVGRGTTIHNRTTIRGPVIIGEHCEIGPNTYIGPYTSIGDHVTLANTEIENSIVMNGAHIDCGKRITDSLIGRKVRILNHEHNVPKGHKLILGDQSTVTL